MPFDSNGVFSLTPGYLAVTGETIQPTQHNPPLEDIAAQGLSEVLVRDGRAPMTGALNMNGFKAIGLLAGTAGTDAVNKTQLDAVSSLITGAQARVVTKTANYTALDADYAASIQFTTAATLSFDTTANLRTNWRIEVWNNSAGLVPIDPASTDTINGTATLVLQPGQWAEVIKTGATTFRAIVFGDPLSGPQIQGYASGLALTTNVADATNDVDIAVGVAAADVSPYNLMQLTSALTKRLDASWAVGTNQGGLDTGAVGNNTYYIWLIQRSDTGVVDALFSLSSTAPTMPTNYDRKRLLGLLVRESAANGSPYLNAKNIGNIGLILLSKGPIPSSAAVDFSIPAGVRRVTLELTAFSTNGTSVPIVQLRSGGVAETTGYSGSAATITSGATTPGNLASGFSLSGNVAAVTVFHVRIEIVLQDNNTWMAFVKGSLSNTAGVVLGDGSKTLAGALDGIRLTTVGGTDVPDAGRYTLYVEY